MAEDPANGTTLGRIGSGHHGGAASRTTTRAACPTPTDPGSGPPRRGRRGIHGRRSLRSPTDRGAAQPAIPYPQWIRHRWGRSRSWSRSCSTRTSPSEAGCIGVGAIAIFLGVFQSFIVPVPEGARALLLKGGRYHRTLGAGRHIVPPWIVVSHVVTMREIPFDALAGQSRQRTTSESTSTCC